MPNNWRRPEKEDQVNQIIKNSPTYHDMEDLVRYLDSLNLETWAVRTISSMRDTLVRLREAI